jgi:guanylate kinase
MSKDEYIHQRIIIITAPSGAGKTSITHWLLKKYPQLAFSVSATTRAPRDHEKDGVDYYFLSVNDFSQKIVHKEFAEWEMVYEGKYYGTLKSELKRIWSTGRVPLLDIEVKGAIHMQKQYPKSILSLFIEPPSVDELRRRLEMRGTETAASLEARVNKAAYEISFRHHFDKIIVNKELDAACRDADAAIQGFLGTCP